MRGRMAAQWLDLLDPSHDELRAAAPRELEETAVELLLADPKHDDEPRPTLQSHGDYIFGVLLLARAVLEENCVYYQEIDVVITRDTLVTVRKTPPGREPFDLAPVRGAVKKTDSAGMIAYRLVDNIAEVEEGDEVFPHDVEVAFNGAYDKLLRALDGLELSRDLLSSVRDYHQSKIANDQNEVMKRLTVIASLLLLPTFIVGLYGENFVNIPELHWHFGYGYVWGVIVATTLVQLWFYRRRGWI